ncbi:MAG: hypothetical protein QOC61_141 [Acidobacteriota bacterium]|nr:hypothetical protein [Acidobacteriota bacterium]
MLSAGEAITRELAGGGSDLYALSLLAGQYLHVTVEQEGVDVVVTLTAPSGARAADIDSMNDEYGPELLSHVAAQSGRYLLKVASLKADAEPGRYTLTVNAAREPTVEDRTRMLAEKTFDEGERLLARREAASVREAHAKYEEALALWRQVGDRRGEAHTLYCLAYIHSLYGEMVEANTLYGESLRISAAEGDRPSEAITHFSIALDYVHTGEMHEAFEHFAPALELRLGMNNRRGAANVLNALGSAYASTGEAQRSLESFQRALSLYRAVRDYGGEVLTLDNVGCLHAALGDQHLAVEYFSQALAALRVASRRREELGTLDLIDDKYFSLSDHQKTLDEGDRAFVMTSASGPRGGEAYTLYNMGKSYQALGDGESALESYTAALELWRAVGDRDGEGYTLARAAGVRASLGMRSEAVALLERALSIFREIGDRDGEAEVLGEVGAIRFAAGDYAGASEGFSRALEIRKTLGDRRGEALALLELGRTYRAAGQYEQSADCFARSLDFSRSVADRPNEVGTLYEMAALLRERGAREEALAHLREALKLIEALRTEVVSPALRASYLASVRGHYELYIDLLMGAANGRTPGAVADAFEASERGRARSLLDQLGESRADIRSGVEPLLLERERSLQRLLNSKAEYRTRLLAGAHTSGQAEAVGEELRALSNDYEEVESEIRVRSPRYAALTRPEPLPLIDVQRKVLDGDTLLLEYSLGSERSFLWAVTRDEVKAYELPGRAVIEEKARRVYGLLSTEAPAAAEQEHAYREAATALSRMLLGPAARMLGTKRLVVVPDGALYYVPFSALPDPQSPESKVLSPWSKTGHEARAVRAPAPAAPSPDSNIVPLIVGHEVVTLPSASVLALLRRESSGRTAAGAVAVLADPVFSADDPRVAMRGRAKHSAGDAQNSSAAGGRLMSALRDMGEGGELPRLLYSRREAEAIIASVPQGQGLKALDFAASRATAISPELGRYRAVHFATHALLDSEHPELSGVVLSLVDERGRPLDGFLRLNEVYNLRLSADFVVLSACRTALGGEVGGEGLVGLTRGFMYAGSPRVVASLWRVGDAATADLMSRFYTHVFKDGMTPAAALRAAQAEMYEQRLWHSPRNWAAFVLQGDWK